MNTLIPVEPVPFALAAPATPEHRAAVISDCGRFRYTLTRQWDANAPLLCYLCLNPSTADASYDDSTIRRCRGFAVREGYGGFVMINLWAYRATDPQNLKAAGYPEGLDNRWHIFETITHCKDTVAAWGAHDGATAFARQLFAQMKFEPLLKCFGVTADGSPKHPLYLSADAPLMPWRGLEMEAYA